MSAQPTCKERWAKEKDGRVADLRKLWKAYQEGDENGDEDLGTFTEYGLSFDYVAPDTFTDQPKGYYTWLLSTGGPQEEFRFYPRYANDPEPVIRFWFLDWFDGYGRALVGKDRALLLEIWQDWRDCGMTQRGPDEE